MRAVKTYSFKIGTKIPFPEWPSIVNTFLKEQNLNYDSFRYIFEAFAAENRKSSCRKAVKDCPALGPVLETKTEYNTIEYLTNVGCCGGASEQDILPLMSKIYRWYGFSDTNLIYQDVDFFGQNIPSLDQGESPEEDLPAGYLTDFLYCRFFGSAIKLHRCIIDTQWNGIDLCIDLLHGDELLDPSPYRDAMQKLLPGIKCIEHFSYCLSQEEKARYAELNDSAEPLIRHAETYFERNLPPEKISKEKAPAKTASILKKLCKKYGYTYAGYEYYMYFMRKKTPRGNYIVLEADTEPSHEGIGIHVGFQGIGFNHGICYHAYECPDKNDLTENLTGFFDTLAAAEKSVFEELDNHFPPTPDWFQPGDIR